MLLEEREPIRKGKEQRNETVTWGQFLTHEIELRAIILYIMQIESTKLQKRERGKRSVCVCVCAITATTTLEESIQTQKPIIHSLTHSPNIHTWDKQTNKQQTLIPMVCDHLTFKVERISKDVRKYVVTSTESFLSRFDIVLILVLLAMIVQVFHVLNIGVQSLFSKSILSNFRVIII
jgi:hypothetical protein